jgi:hypothetical protein
MEKQKMEMIPVRSSHIAAIGYDSRNTTLKVEFLDGGLYEYYGISEMIFNDFKNAGSKGIFFDRNIKKGGYQVRKL